MKWPVALALLGYLFYRHREEFGQLDARQIQWTYFALAFTLCLAAIVSTFVRWYLLVWAQEFAFQFRDALRLGFLGYFFNYMAPGGAAGGDVVKALMIARRQQSRRMVAVATVLLDRMLGLLGLLLVGATAGLYPTTIAQRPEFRTIIGTFWVGGVMGLVGLAVMMHPAIPKSRRLNKLVRLPVVGRTAGDLINAVLLYQSRWRVLVVAIIISIGGHVLMLSAFYCCALALHAAETVPDFGSHLQFVPPAELAGVVVPLPGGIGALEGALAYFYGIAGAAQGDGFLTGIGYRVISILIAAVGAGYYFTSHRDVDEVLETAAAPPSTVTSA